MHIPKKKRNLCAVFAVVGLVCVITWLAARDPGVSTSMEALFDVWQHESGPGEMEALLAFAARAEEAQPWLEDRVRSGDAHARYGAARLAGQLGWDAMQPALLELALDAAAPDAARVGAFYALKEVNLPYHAANAILEAAVRAEASIVRRGALAALSGRTADTAMPLLVELARHDDALTRVYAGRLLMEAGSDPGTDHFTALARHPEYLVRQETYDALAWSDADGVAALLEEALETNASAARALRLARGLHQARQQGESGEDRFFALVLRDGDDDERLWVADTLLGRDPERGMKALRQLADDPSELGLYARTRLRLRQPDAGGTEATAEYAADALKHNFPTHNLLTNYTLARYHQQDGYPPIAGADQLRFIAAEMEEDVGLIPLTHAHNPLTGRGFLWYDGFGGSSGAYTNRLLEELEIAVDAEDNEAVWALAGRMHHLIQDMTSPLHIFGVWHPFGTCLYEVYWPRYVQEVNAMLRDAPFQPADPREVVPGSAGRLDPFSRARLEERLAGMPLSLYGYFEATSWLTYFTASHWGEIRFGDGASGARTLPADYPEESVGEQDNVLHAMFDGNIRYHTSWLRNYFEIEDRHGNTYSWNKCFALDGFRPCPNPRGGLSREGHLRNTVSVGDAQVLRITGRFYFTQRGFRAPHCHPYRYPDGEPMEAHLVRYYGESLIPATVSYTVGWLNTFAALAPNVFAHGASESEWTGQGIEAASLSLSNDDGAPEAAPGHLRVRDSMGEEPPVATGEVGDDVVRVPDHWKHLDRAATWLRALLPPGCTPTDNS